jgi:hypothetical protein
VKRLKKGPQLKLPELKVPPPLRDLYHDLRDRRLLPLLALVVVAIFAVPFLFGKSAEEEAPPLQHLSPQGQTAEETALQVVEATPPLRDYRRRLRARVASNPFKQEYTAPVLKGATLNSESQTSSASSSSSTSETSESGGGGEAGVGAPPSQTPAPEGAGGGSDGGHGGGGSGGAGGNPDLRLYTWTMKVQISHTETASDGTTRMGQPEVRDSVKSLTPLPGAKAPVVTFMGVNPSSGKALLMVSKEVTAVFGDAKCISGTGSCELLEVEKGFPEAFEYGPNHVRYKFKVISIDLVRIPKS